MNAEETKQCKECNNEFKTKWKGIFCSRSCATKFNNKRRPPESDETRRKKSESLKRAHKEHPEYFPRSANHSKEVGEYTKGKYKGDSITSILDVSKRTASKILKRLNIGCCICGWKEASCDIHHINGRNVEDADGHWNLTCVCPNHHRMYHNKKLKKEDFIPLTKYFPENWKEMYYG